MFGSVDGRVFRPHDVTVSDTKSTHLPILSGNSGIGMFSKVTSLNLAGIFIVPKDKM